MPRPTNQEAQELERRYLDALYILTHAEVAAHTGLLTKAKQTALVTARRSLTHVQTSLLQLWLSSNSQPSTLGPTEDDPTVDHDVEGDDGSEVTFDA